MSCGHFVFSGRSAEFSPLAEEPKNHPPQYWLLCVHLHPKKGKFPREKEEKMDPTNVESAEKILSHKTSNLNHFSPKCRGFFLFFFCILGWFLVVTSDADYQEGYKDAGIGGERC